MTGIRSEIAIIAREWECVKEVDFPQPQPKIKGTPRPYVLGPTGRVIRDPTSAPDQAACTM